MAEPHDFLNALSEDAAREALRACCGSKRWVEGMLAERPFASAEALFAAAEAVWGRLEREDFLEAFAHHPEIGADLDALRRKYGASLAYSEREQAGVAGADEATLLALRDANRAYRERFGYIFIVCATGKSARAMLELLQARLDNDPSRELAIAAAEQAKITRLRLEKLGS